MIDGAITSTDVTMEPALNFTILTGRLNADDIAYRHDRTLLCAALDELLGMLFKPQEDDVMHALAEM